MDVLRDVRLYDVRSVRNSIPMNRWLKQITYNALWRSNRKRARFLLEPLPTLNSNSVVVPTPIIKYIVVPNLSINGDKLCPKRITGLCSPKIVPSQTAKTFQKGKPSIAWELENCDSNLSESRNTSPKLFNLLVDCTRTSGSLLDRFRTRFAVKGKIGAGIFQGAGSTASIFYSKILFKIATRYT